jgi:hypothetical protein
MAHAALEAQRRAIRRILRDAVGAQMPGSASPCESIGRTATAPTRAAICSFHRNGLRCDIPIFNNSGSGKGRLSCFLHIYGVRYTGLVVSTKDFFMYKELGAA